MSGAAGTIGRSLVGASRWEAAEALAAGLANVESIVELAANARAAAADGPTTVLERTLVETVEENVKDLAISVVQSARSDEREEVLDQLLTIVTEPDFQQPRRRVLGDFAACTVPLLLAAGGTTALDRMIDAFHDMDNRLREAARLSAET
jgi:hypothetical protein